MTDPADHPPQRKRRRRWLLLLLLPPLMLAGIWLYQSIAADARLGRAIAEADRLDPHWRWHDIEAGRVVIPDEENGALIVIAARAKMPRTWSAADPWKKLSNHYPDDKEVLTEQQMTDVRAGMAPVAEALQEARKLADRPRGRFPPGTDAGIASYVELLLNCDALLRSQEGDLDGALDSLRTSINAARSVGDEPQFGHQWMRRGMGSSIASLAGRVLGQGEPSASALAAFQRALEEEAEAPTFLTGVRGERAAYDHLMEALQRGDLTPQQIKAFPGSQAAKSLVSSQQALYMPAVKNNRAILLEQMNAFVEISKLPSHEQAAALSELKELSMPPSQPFLVRLGVLPGGVERWGMELARYKEQEWEDLAHLRCGIAALAVERYRRKHGRWPESLADLQDEFLRAVPLNPFDGDPLGYRKDDEGVIVFSVRTGKPWTYSVHLWDVDKRAQRK
jgi:hypothetical protein